MSICYKIEYQEDGGHNLESPEPSSLIYRFFILIPLLAMFNRISGESSLRISCFHSYI